ncbi:MAG: TolC family protein [Spirochaetia bacterium]
MKKPLRLQVLLAFSAVLAMNAPTGGAQEAAASAPETVTLDQAVATALANGPGLKLNTFTLDTARTQLVQTQAKNGLSVGETADYLHQGTLPTDVSSLSPAAVAAAAAASKSSATSGEVLQGGVSVSGPATSVGLTAQHTIAETVGEDQVSSVSLSASQTLYDGYPGGRANATVQQADYTYRSAQIAFDAGRKSLIYQVKQAYYTLLGDQNTVVVDQAIVKQAEENLAFYQGLFTAQRATSLDVLAVQVTLSQAQLNLRTAQNTVLTDRKNLSLAVGWPLDRQYAVADSPPPDLPALPEAEALKTAYANRSELVTLQLNIAAANVNLALQKSQSAPVVSINGSLGVGQDWTVNNAAGVFTAGLSIALPPIYDGGLVGAQVQQAVDQVASLKVQQDQQQQSITIAVQNALFGVTDARNRLDWAGDNLKQAQGQYDLTKAKFAVGLQTTLDVLTAFSALSTAQVGLQQAKITYVLAVLNLNNVMGL